jgi:CRISPR/Cas system-associated endonuclease/helicase Cas3
MTATLPKRFLEKWKNKLQKKCGNVVSDALNVISGVRWRVLIRKPCVILKQNLWTF